MRTIDTLPDFLKEYCTVQDTTKYTARNHAVWRYIMRRSLPFFRQHAVGIYENGLKKTGLPIDKIPDINEMDAALQKIGWGAVPVCGFIAPWAFIEFQSRKILPIATDIRNVENISYTPAPDIVHEAAGHAPIIPDQEYSDYLSRYGKLCTKAIYSEDDLRIFEAVRYLSDIKEKSDSTTTQVAEAERNLTETAKSCTYVSEQTKVARMSWWTNEYGLVGSLEDPKIYGAGLLSSVSESKGVYSDKVKKVRLSLDCINKSYDITKPQPQLYVAKDMQHLISVLDELEATLAYRVGGCYALHLGKESQAITTTLLDNGLEISGKLVAYELAGEKTKYLEWDGPIQLSYQGKQIETHGPERHPDGFRCCLGRVKSAPQKTTGKMSPQELENAGFIKDSMCQIQFETGFQIEGKLLEIKYSKDQSPLFATFNHFKMSRGGKIYFQTQDELMQLPLADSVPSVYGGPADRSNFGNRETTNVTTVPGRQEPYSDQEQKLFDKYQELREIRSNNTNEQIVKTIAEKALKDYPDEWLYILEIYEIGRDHLKVSKDTPWLRSIYQQLLSLKEKEQYTELIEVGLELIT